MSDCLSRLAALEDLLRGNRLLVWAALSFFHDHQGRGDDMPGFQPLQEAARENSEFTDSP
jgi:hypothetical protein